MKIKNILLSGVAALSLFSCNDYLEVDAPSAYTTEFVFSMKSEAERALNGVYAKALVGDLYGNLYQSTFILNSDVDITISSASQHAHNTYARFDCDDQGSDIAKFWSAAYTLIEYCNMFVKAAEESKLYDTSDSEYMQWIGEAKCLRAMVYHDLVVMFGDVPFTFTPTATRGTAPFPIVDRTVIQDSIISDLKAISPFMANAKSVTVERCSKEFAQGLIARIALTAGGYSLRPDKSNPRNYGTMQRPDNYLDYYKIARDYADSVITAGGHHLNLSYQDVFINECNYRVVNDDDPIFELPFAKESTGNVGYIQGPSYAQTDGKSVGVWGECKGSTKLNAFYRFLFPHPKVAGVTTGKRESPDQRCEFVNGLWYYGNAKSADGNYIDTAIVRNDYYVHNNKWSKLWTDPSLALGDISTGSTGINYPYMRYADILLIYAETANELDGGPTDAKAVECLREVHKRAYEDGDPDFITAAKASKDAFHTAVMNERKWEFAGENSRWRDLVRTNTYGEELVYSFLRYYSAAMQAEAGATGYEDAINDHDGYGTDGGYINKLPSGLWYHEYNIDEVKFNGLRTYKRELYGYFVDSLNNVQKKYPNQSLKSLRIVNAYNSMTCPAAGTTIKRADLGFTASDYIRTVKLYQWGNGNSGIKDQCKYSFYGYIRYDNNTIMIIDNGTPKQFGSTIPAASQLPAVRYILPLPNLVVQRSSGLYQNYYGY